EAIIHDGSDGVIFNEFEFGGYLIYRLNGKNKIFLDGRNIIYSSQDFEKYKEIILSNDDSYQEYFDQYKVRYVIVKNREFGLSSLLKRDLNYKSLYSSDDHVVFVRVN